MCSHDCAQDLDFPGGTPYNGLYGEAPPKRGTFFRLQVYKRVGEVEVYKRVATDTGATVDQYTTSSGPVFDRYAFAVTLPRIS